MENQEPQGPEPAVPLIPARILNEYIYCPRLAYLEWIHAEFAENAYTVDGSIKHRRVDRPGRGLPEPMPEVAAEEPTPEAAEETEATAVPEKIHARSVALSSDSLGLTAKIDLVEGDDWGGVVPVDYKRGKRPHVQGGVYDPERVQLCAQGLLLREHGYACREGVIYFVASKERVVVAFDQELVGQTLAGIAALRESAGRGEIPPPLEDGRKCPRCSLVGICLPDEVKFLHHLQGEVRPIIPANDRAVPLYVQSPRARVRKDGERLIIEEEKERVGEARIGEVSQVALFGWASMSTPALHECLRRDIPVTWLSYGGWFVGHTVGTGHRNVETRTHQYRVSFDHAACLRLARSLVAAKIANCRTLLRRNWRGPGEKVPPETLLSMQDDIRRAVKAESLPELLGVEGTAAARYYRHLPQMLKSDDACAGAFDFRGRNRRPPRDPVNALLSFAYSMLVREWTIALAAVGLDPYRGFYHQPRFGRPALALDMMEPFRPLIADSTVLTAINNGEVQARDFFQSAGGCTLRDSGRKRFLATFERRMTQEVTHPIFKYRISYRRLLEVQARLLGRHLAGEISHYPNFLTR